MLGLRNILFVICILVFLGCGSSSKQRFGESFALIGVAKYDISEDKQRCTFEAVNEVLFSSSTSVVICLIVENKLTKQSIIIRDYEVELRIPGALAQVPVYRITMPGFLKPAPESSNSDGSNGNQQVSTSLNPNQFTTVLTQGDESTQGNMASIPIYFPPLELITWLLANSSALPRGILPVETIFRVNGQTSPGGDWISTNKFYLRSYLVR